MGQREMQPEDNAAVAQLYAAYSEPIGRQIKRDVRAINPAVDDSVHEDLLHTTFVDYILGLKPGARPKDPLPYLFAIARNVVKEWLLRSPLLTPERVGSPLSYLEDHGELDPEHEAIDPME